MNEGQNKNIFDLTEREFIAYFKEKIAPNYEEIKTENKKHDFPAAIQIGCISIIFAPFLLGALAFLSNLSNINSENIGKYIYIGLFFGIFLIIFLRAIKKMRATQTGNIINASFKEKNFNLLGFKYTNCSYLFKADYAKIAEIHKVYGKILEETFAFFGRIDEIIQYVYQNMSFAILDLVEEGKPPKYSLCLAFKIKKNFYSEVWLRDKKSTLSGIRPVLNVLQNTLQYDKDVNLEDIHFTEEYQVYAHDQVEARYLLTTSFMERLLKYKLSKNCGVEVVFTPRYFGLYNLFFFIETKKNMFELPEREIPDIEITARYFYRILSEIKELLQIVDTLKLDQDIGM